MAVQNRLRRDNLNRVIETVWRNQGISRAGLSRTLRMDRSTAGQLSDFLIHEGILQEYAGGSTGPKGGRPPTLLRVQANVGYSLGIELTYPTLRFSAIDLTGISLLERSVDIPADPSTVLPTLIREIGEIRKAIRSAGTRSSELLTVGVGVSGVVDSVLGAIELSDAFHIHETTEIAEPLFAAFGVPIALYNDAQACARGESSRKDRSDLLFTVIEFRPGYSPEDIGVGLGIVLDGQLRHGRTITHLLRPETGENNAAFLQNLAHSLALIANVTGVTEIVLGGDAEDVFDDLAPQIRRFASREDRRIPDPPLRISKPLFGDRAVSVGAAYAAFERLFQNLTFPMPQ